MNNVTYIHIPKTAGLAIREFAKNNPNTVNYTHHKIYEELITERPDDVYITMVRNPYDRFVSSYFFYKDLYKGKRTISEQINQYEDFNDFCINFNDFEFKEDLQFIPQMWYLYDKNNGAKITMVEDYQRRSRPKRANIYAGRFESFSSSLSMFSSLVEKNVSLEHVNKSSHKHWSSYYISKESIDLVNNLFSIDFEELGYTKIN